MDPLTHKPIEQKQQIDDDDDDDKNKTNKQPNNISAGYEENVGIKLLGSDGTKENKVTWDDTAFEMLCSNLDLGTWMNQDTNTSTNSVSSSCVSMDDTSHISVDESSYLHQNSLQEWVNSMNSILSWDGFNPLDQDISFLERNK